MCKFLLIASIVILVATKAYPAREPDQRALDLVKSGEYAVARASWWGFEPEDATESLQAAIDSGVPRLVVDNVGKQWVVRPITLAGDQTIIFEKGVEVVARKGEFKGRSECLFRAELKDNITLIGYGATLRMHRSDYDDSSQYEKAEWRHILSFRSCSNVKIYGLTLEESGGDGIYLGTAIRGVTNKNVHIKDVICDRNYRQGISVITAEDLLIENTIMRDTAGTPPQAGIDFEPNHPYERLVNVVMRNCVTQGNAGDGYEFYLRPMKEESEPVSIRLENCRSINDKVSGVRIVTGNSRESAVKGSIEFVGCEFENSGHSGVTIWNTPVGSLNIRFSDCKIVNAAVEKPTMTPIMFLSRHEAAEPIGGFEFDDCLVRDPLDRNPIGYTDHAGGVPVQSVSGRLTVEHDGGRQEFEITSEQLARWIPPSNIKAIPRLKLDDMKLEPLTEDRSPDGYDLRFAGLRWEGRFVIHAAKGEEVRIKLRHEQVGKIEGGVIPAVLDSPSEKDIRRFVVPFKEDCEIVFTAPETGTYRLTVDPGRSSIRMLSSTHPVCITGGDGPIHMIRAAGDYAFWVPPGTNEFGVRVTGEGTGEAIRALLINPKGETVGEVDNNIQTHQFEVTLEEPSRGEVWTLRLMKPSSIAWEDHSVDLRGIPPLLAPSRDALLIPAK